MSNILGGPNADEIEEEPISNRDVGEALAYVVDPGVAVDRARLYSLVAIGLDRPGEELDMLLSENEFGSELKDAAAGLDEPDIAYAANAVAEAAESVGVEDLYHRWGSLFGVEEGVTVSPYELTYLPGPLLTTTRDLADISGFYRAFGLRIAEGQNDRADHILFQTEFLSHLSLREATLQTEEETEGVAVVVGARRAFIDDHLGRWYWRFAEEVSKRDDGFYAALTDLVATLVETEIDQLDVDPDWVPDDPEVAEWTEDIFGDSGRGCGGCGVGGSVPPKMDDTNLPGDVLRDGDAFPDRPEEN